MGCLGVFAVIVGVGCGGGSADPTKEKVSDNDLVLIANLPRDISGQYKDFLDPGSPMGQSKREEGACRRGQPSELAKLGWTGGYDQVKINPKSGSIPVAVVARVDLYRDPDAAKNGLDLLRRDAVSDNAPLGCVGKLVREFDSPEVGDESWGGIFAAPNGQQSGSEAKVTFRIGRLVMAISALGTDEQRLISQVTAFAPRVDEWIRLILRTHALPSFSATPVSGA